MKKTTPTDVDIIKRLLRQSLNAREFVARAVESEFTIIGEGPTGLEMRGRNSRLILTVLASYGANTIFTLSIKQGGEPVVSLVDNCKLLY